KQSRGQQGIGISAAGMYGHLTTGKPITAISRTAKGKPAHAFDIRINTRSNEPEILRDEEVDFDLDHGTQVEIELEGIYKRGKRSVDEYLQATAVANPHCQVTFIAPDGEKAFYPRAAEELPIEAREIKPHPHGVELGMLMKIIQDTRAPTIKSALTSDFSRVSDKVSTELLKEANISVRKKPRDAMPAEIERLHKIIQKKQLLAPPTNCLSPIGEDLLRTSLESRYECELVFTRTRRPAVYRGNPFQIEVGLAYGGKLPVDALAEVLRLANRVPLQYQANAGAIAKAVMGVDWKNYGLQQARGALPSGPMVICVHIASAWVPFTSESKEAVAHYPEIVKEMRLALQDCGRELARHIRSKRRAAEELKKRSYIEKYIPHIGIALKEILELSDKDEMKIIETLRDTLERSRTRVQVKGNVELALAEELDG
ncbi:MAG: DNA topoisomerase VI subunit B, partial [Chrysiogenetes bacterium]|nr:DNA topoisomerase VI subunit B [Chrysiogenetes bacterium]